MSRFRHDPFAKLHEETDWEDRALTAEKQLEAKLGQLDRIIHDPEPSDDEKWDAAIAILDGEK